MKYHDETDDAHRGDKASVQVVEEEENDINLYSLSNQTPADLVFMLEASENMMNYNWKIITNWITNLIQQAKFEKGYTNLESMIIVIRFQTYPSESVNRLMQRRKEALARATGVETVIETMDGQDSYDALSLINNDYYGSLRKKSKKVLISLTDGLYRNKAFKSKLEKESILETTMDNFDAVIAVGYGSSVNEDEILEWSKEIEGMDSAFLLDDVEQLEEVTGVILEGVTFALNN